MFTLYSDTVKGIFYQFYRKKEVIKKSKAMHTPYNQIPEQKILIDSLAIKLKQFQEKWDQRSKQ